MGLAKCCYTNRRTAAVWDQLYNRHTIAFFADTTESVGTNLCRIQFVGNENNLHLTTGFEKGTHISRLGARRPPANARRLPHLPPSALPAPSCNVSSFLGAEKFACKFVFDVKQSLLFVGHLIFLCLTENCHPEHTKLIDFDVPHHGMMLYIATYSR